VKQQEEFLATQSDQYVREYRQEPGRQALNGVGGVLGFSRMLKNTVVGAAEAIRHPIVAGGKVKEFFSDFRGNVSRGYDEMLDKVAAHEARGEHIRSGAVASEKVSADAFAVIGTVQAAAAITRLGTRALTGTVVESESQVGGFANITPEAAALAEFSASVPEGAYGVGNALPRAAAAAGSLAADAPKGGASIDALVSSRGTVKISGGDYRNAAVGEGSDGALYLLKDAKTGEVLKVGKTEAETAVGRFQKYETASRYTGRTLEVEILDVKKTGSFTTESAEKAVRSHYELMGEKLPWDNTGGRLGRPGPGVPGTRLPRSLREQGYAWEGTELIRSSELVPR
jgi:hypothetical protein